MTTRAPGGPIRSVLIAGGGIVAWCAAAALRRRAPFLQVTVVASTPPANALADRIASALPSLRAFHADLGLSEDDAVARTRSGRRLGTIFSGWAADRPDYVHAYGGYGRSPGGGPFHLHWVRAALAGGAPAFDAFSPAAVAARAGRATPPGAEDEAGLALDVGRYRAMMRAFALHLGAVEIAGDVAGARVEGGRIAEARLTDGRALSADLYVDATGPVAALRSALPSARDDWTRWTPCDRVRIAHGSAPAEPPVVDRVIAVETGWRWEGGSPGATQRGSAWSSAHADAEEDGGEPARLSPGARRDAWACNCLAIGDAATEVEPLEWCNLHLATRAIDRLIALLPDRDFAAVEIANYNRQSLAEAERVRDFVALHYLTARRIEPMWRDLRATEPPASLALTLAQFRERGRLPFHEEEAFARDGWLAVLFGQGELPRRVDPLIGAVPPERARAAMDADRAAIARAVTGYPTPAAPTAAETRRIAQ